MKSSARPLRNLVFFIFSLFMAAAAQSEVNVAFIKPEKFQDVGIRQRDIDRTLHDLEQHLQQLGTKYLAGAQKMKVEILDVDLAGRYESFRLHRTDDVRVMKAADWPRIKLRYTLTDGDKVVRQGEEWVSDVNYLERINTYPESDPLRYEKRMLEDWFRAILKK